MKLESYVTAIIEGKKKAPLAKSLLLALSGVQKAGSALNHRAYGTFLPQTRLPCPVVSVGNIACGGTGKTPLVCYLAKKFAPKKVAILSRGYKRKSSKILVVEPATPTELSGDEPKLLKQKLPNALVIVGKNRADSGLLAIELGAELLLLDDGFQHRKLHRDLEIVTLDGQNPFGGGHYLPYGYLRDSPQKLSKADLIVLNQVEGEEHFEKVKEELKPYTQAPIVSMAQEIKNSDAIEGKSVASFCAIAKPARFQKTLQALKAEVLLTFEKPDHDPFGQDELKEFAKKAKSKGAKALVCTEKDAVKLPSTLTLDLPILPLEMHLKPQHGCEQMETLLHGVLS